MIPSSSYAYTPAVYSAARQNKLKREGPLEIAGGQAYNVKTTNLTMPVELRRTHQANDKAVMQAYGFWGSVKTESDCVARLMEMYARMTE